MYEEQRGSFEPKHILSLPEDELEHALRTYLRPRYINEAKIRYKANSQKLLDEFSGDPQRIFLESDTAAEALRKVRDFRGFGPKIGNFYVRTMINTFDYKYGDVEEIMPPVDVHDVHIAFLLGYVDSKEMTQKNIKKVTEIWSEACKESGESWLVFDKALWLLGSEGKPKSSEDVLALLE